MRAHHDDNTDYDMLVPNAARHKGKGRAVERPDSDVEMDEPFTPPPDPEFGFGSAKGVSSYPPTNEEEEESRRVEEVCVFSSACPRSALK